MGSLLEKKVIKVYKNWGVYRTASICKIKKERVLEILKKNKVELRTRGWNWRENDLHF